MIFDPLYLLLLAPALLLGAWAQWKVKSAYAAAKMRPAAGGVTGAQAAAHILESHGVSGVGIEPTRGFLGDHYDPRSKTLRLSPDVYNGRSLAAVGIAAHEAGHALQDAHGYAPLALRNGIVPMASIGSTLSWILLVGGILIGSAAGVFGQWLIFGGIGLYSVVVLFQLINLPVEFNASSRARQVLTSTGIVSADQDAVVGKVLNAAALTYVAATVTAILTLVYFLMRAGLLGGRDE